MDINRMKLGLIYIFSENDKISKKAKLHLINFIENANEHQIKVLAMDGELISKETLDENTINIINDRFSLMTDLIETLKKASLKGLQEIAPAVVGVGAGMAAAGAAAGLYQRRKAKKACLSKFPDKNSEGYKKCYKHFMGM